LVSIGLILLGGATRTRGNDRREGGSRRDRSNSVRIPRATALNRIAYPVLPREHWGTKVGMLMRPSLLNPFFALITTLPGVGSQLEKLYRRLFGREEEARVVDLLFHLPTGAIDRRRGQNCATSCPTPWSLSRSPSIGTGRRHHTGRARPIRSTPAMRPAISF
jgi:hypothetical protein